MPTFGGRIHSEMAMNGRVGVLAAAEVNGPLANNGSGSTALFSADSAATWAAILFVASIVLLFFVL